MKTNKQIQNRFSEQTISWNSLKFEEKGLERSKAFEK
jgi:hypothetical protein